MTKSKGVSRRQINAIRSYSRKHCSANRIQRELSRRGIGLKRTTVLKYVRESKGKPPKAHPYKYTPIKYRKSFMISLGKQVAGYGSVHGKPRRIQMRGMGKELYQAMRLTVKHPPKEQFLTIPAWKLISDPRKYLDYEESWDEHPEINS